MAYVIWVHAALASVALAGCSSGGGSLSCPDGSVAVSDPSRRLAYCAPVCTDGGVCSCPTGRVSIWSRTAGAAACAPACGDGGACPGGLRCQSCLVSGDCPVCAVCVEACASAP